VLDVFDRGRHLCEPSETWTQGTVDAHVYVRPYTVRASVNVCVCVCVCVFACVVMCVSCVSCVPCTFVTPPPFLQQIDLLNLTETGITDAALPFILSCFPLLTKLYLSTCNGIGE
jgi:hypothetical protein